MNNERKPFNKVEVKFGNTIYVISEYYSDKATETVEAKLIRLIRRDMNASIKKWQTTHFD